MNDPLITTWTCSHDQAQETSTYEFENGVTVQLDHKLHRAYTIVDGEAIEEPISTIDMSIDEWTSILVGKQKLYS